MNDFGLRPEPPEWALFAGLPVPRNEEGFTEYVTRLGLDASELLIELTPRTICIANLRLAHALRQRAPAAFDRHLEELASKHITPERREELRSCAQRLWGTVREKPSIHRST